MSLYLPHSEQLLLEGEQRQEYMSRFHLRDLVEGWIERVCAERPADPYQLLIDEVTEQRASGGGIVTCPNKWCGMIMPAASYEAHRVSCDQAENWVRCVRCSERVEVGRIEQHRVHCRMQCCPYCGEMVLPRMLGFCPYKIIQESERSMQAHRYLLEREQRQQSEGMRRQPPTTPFASMLEDNGGSPSTAGSALGDAVDGEDGAVAAVSPAAEHKSIVSFSALDMSEAEVARHATDSKSGLGDNPGSSMALTEANTASSRSPTSFATSGSNRRAVLSHTRRYQSPRHEVLDERGSKHRHRPPSSVQSASTPHSPPLPASPNGPVRKSFHPVSGDRHRGRRAADEETGATPVLPVHDAAVVKALADYPEELVPRLNLLRRLSRYAGLVQRLRENVFAAVWDSMDSAMESKGVHGTSAMLMPSVDAHAGVTAEAMAAAAEDLEESGAPKKNSRAQSLAGVDPLNLVSLSVCRESSQSEGPDAADEHATDTRNDRAAATAAAATAAGPSGDAVDEGVTVSETPDPTSGAYMTLSSLEKLLALCATRQVFRVGTVLSVIRAAVRVLAEPSRANVVQFVTIPSQGGDIAIFGDLHGQMKDLMHALHLMGDHPTARRYFLFNGDFIDRGPYGCEVIVCIFALLCTYPQYVYLNRGNHEDHRTNTEYGFMAELFVKYGSDASRIHELLIDSYQAMPLMTIVDRRVAVVHGGVPRDQPCALADISAIGHVRDIPVAAQTTPAERLLADLLWSDPVEKYRSRQLGARHQGTGWRSSKRGCGAEYLQTITEQFLKANKLQLVVRSHDVMQAGFEIIHGGKSVTVFSASNYGGVSGNRGAVALLSKETRKPVFHTWFLKEDIGERHGLLDTGQLTQRSSMTASGDGAGPAVVPVNMTDGALLAAAPPGSLEYGQRDGSGGGGGAGVGPGFFEDPNIRVDEFIQAFYGECVSAQDSSAHPHDADGALALQRQQREDDDTAILLQLRSVQELREMIFLHRYTLLTAFNNVDENHTGMVYKVEWCVVMRDVLDLDLPWYYLCQFFAPQMEVDGIASVEYMRFLCHFDAMFTADYRPAWQRANVQRIFESLDLPDDLIRCFCQEDQTQAALAGSTRTATTKALLNSPSGTSAATTTVDTPSDSTSTAAGTLPAKGRATFSPPTSRSRSPSRGPPTTTVSSPTDTLAEVLPLPARAPAANEHGLLLELISEADVSTEAVTPSAASATGHPAAAASHGEHSFFSPCTPQPSTGRERTLGGAAGPTHRPGLKAFNASNTSAPGAGSSATSAAGTWWREVLVDFKTFAMQVRSLSPATSCLEDYELYCLFRFFDINRIGFVLLGYLVDCVTELLDSVQESVQQPQELLSGDELVFSPPPPAGGAATHERASHVAADDGTSNSNCTNSSISSIASAGPVESTTEGRAVGRELMNSVDSSASLSPPQAADERSGSLLQPSSLVGTSGGGWKGSGVLRRSNFGAARPFVTPPSDDDVVRESTGQMMTPPLTDAQDLPPLPPPVGHAGTYTHRKSFLAPPQRGSSVSGSSAARRRISSRAKGAGAGSASFPSGSSYSSLSNHDEDSELSLTATDPRELPWVFPTLMHLQAFLLGGNSRSRLALMFRALNQRQDGKLTEKQFAAIVSFLNHQQETPLSARQTHVLFNVIRVDAYAYLHGGSGASRAAPTSDNAFALTNSSSSPFIAKHSPAPPPAIEQDAARMEEERRHGSPFILLDEFIAFFVITTARPETEATEVLPQAALLNNPVLLGSLTTLPERRASQLLPTAAWRPDRALYQQTTPLGYTADPFAMEQSVQQTMAQLQSVASLLSCTQQNNEGSGVGGSAAETSKTIVAPATAVAVHSSVLPGTVITMPIVLPPRTLHDGRALSTELSLRAHDRDAMTCSNSSMGPQAAPSPLSPSALTTVLQALWYRFGAEATLDDVLRVYAAAAQQPPPTIAADGRGEGSVNRPPDSAPLPREHASVPLAQTAEMAPPPPAPSHRARQRNSKPGTLSGTHHSHRHGSSSLLLSGSLSGHRASLLGAGVAPAAEDDAAFSASTSSVGACKTTGATRHRRSVPFNDPVLSLQPPGLPLPSNAPVIGAPPAVPAPPPAAPVETWAATAPGAVVNFLALPTPMGGRAVVCAPELASIVSTATSRTLVSVPCRPYLLNRPTERRVTTVPAASIAAAATALPQAGGIAMLRTGFAAPRPPVAVGGSRARVPGQLQPLQVPGGLPATGGGDYDTQGAAPYTRGMPIPCPPAAATDSTAPAAEERGRTPSNSLPSAGEETTLSSRSPRGSADTAADRSLDHSSAATAPPPRGSEDTPPAALIAAAHAPLSPSPPKQSPEEQRTLSKSRVSAEGSRRSSGQTSASPTPPADRKALKKAVPAQAAVTPPLMRMARVPAKRSQHTAAAAPSHLPGVNALVPTSLPQSNKRH